MHPVPVYGQDYEKEKKPGTSYQSLFKLQSIFRKIPFWYDTLNLETVKRKGKKMTKYWVSQEQRELFGENKNDFS